jgi:HEPN domain-containing protein
VSGIEQQIMYWARSSKQDLRVASMLLTNRKTRHGLFFMHLSMEKLLKALVCKTTQQPAPRIHSLPSLAERAGVALDPQQTKFLGRFDLFNIAGRYPEGVRDLPRSPEAQKLAKEFRKIYRCLEKQL